LTDAQSVTTFRFPPNNIDDYDFQNHCFYTPPGATSPTRVRGVFENRGFFFGNIDISGRANVSFIETTRSFDVLKGVGVVNYNLTGTEISFSGFRVVMEVAASSEQAPALGSTLDWAAVGGISELEGDPQADCLFQFEKFRGRRVDGLYESAQGKLWTCSAGQNLFNASFTYAMNVDECQLAGVKSCDSRKPSEAVISRGYFRAAALTLEIPETGSNVVSTSYTDKDPLDLISWGSQLYAHTSASGAEKDPERLIGIFCAHDTANLTNRLYCTTESYFYRPESPMTMAECNLYKDIDLSGAASTTSASAVALAALLAVLLLWW
jgi:hypothetical protein